MPIHSNTSPLKTEPTVLSVWLRPLVDYLNAQGYCSASIFQKTGVDVKTVFVPGARLPLKEAAPLWKHAAEVTGKPFIGLDISQHSSPLQAGTMSVAMLSSRNVYEALQRLKRLVPLVCEGVDVFLERYDDDLHLIYRVQPEYKDIMPVEAMDPSFLLLFGLISGGVTNVDVIKSVHFGRGCPGGEPRIKLQAMLPVDIFFDAPEYRLVVDWHKTQIQNPYWNPELAQLASELSLKEMETLNEENLVSRVCHLILERMPDGVTSQEDVATLLNMSVRQLQRRLKALGTGYSELLQDVRLDLALRYLKDTNMSLADVCFSLGFQDQSNFVKAFKLWQGETPGQYRSRVAVK